MLSRGLQACPHPPSTCRELHPGSLTAAPGEGAARCLHGPQDRLPRGRHGWTEDNSSSRRGKDPSAGGGEGPPDLIASGSREGNEEEDMVPVPL